MKRKFWTILGILIAVGFLTGGYFFASKKGFLVKKEITVSNSINNIEKVADNIQEVPADEKANSPADETTVAQQSKNENAEKQTAPATVKDSVPVEKKIVEPAKQVETKNEAGKIVDKLVSWGFTKSSGRKIDTIIVHSSYNSLGGDVYDPDKIISIYKQYDVSAHYLIGRDGTAYRLVQEKDISWHAGVSKVPDGRTNVNDFSIGIEMINTMDGKYTSAQYDALNRLIGDLESKYEIKYILGHNEIAPGRKTDPWGIDWKKVNR